MYCPPQFKVAPGALVHGESILVWQTIHTINVLKPMQKLV